MFDWARSGWQGDEVLDSGDLLRIGIVATGLVAFTAGSANAQEPVPESVGGEDPWSVPASWTVEEREVPFESEGVRLSGTLYSPEGIDGGPAVVVVQQGGTETRDNPLFLQIQQTFNAIGYSVFLYDRRGYGESGGDPAERHYRLLAQDAIAAKRAIARVDAVHPRQVGFWGLSQGGWLAMEAGAMSDPAFVISVSAPLTTPAEQMELLAHNYVLVHEHGRDAAREAEELRRAVLGEYFRAEMSYDSARTLLAAAEEEPWFEHAFLPRAEQLPEDVASSPWTHEMAYDPVPSFQAVEAPLLFILGGEDIDIPVERTLEVISGFEETGSRDVVVIPGASHLMRIEDDPRDQFDLDPSDIGSNAAEYFMIMGEWLGGLDRRPE